MNSISITLSEPSTESISRWTRWCSSGNQEAATSEGSPVSKVKPSLPTANLGLLCALNSVSCCWLMKISGLAAVAEMQSQFPWLHERVAMKNSRPLSRAVFWDPKYISIVASTSLLLNVNQAFTTFSILNRTQHRSSARVLVAPRVSHDQAANHKRAT